jgi:phosphomannomutase
LYDRYAPDALSVEDVDGYSFEFPEWRFNIRMSNTEPVVRLNVESRGDAALMREKTAEVLAILEG